MATVAKLHAARQPPLYSPLKPFILSTTIRLGIELKILSVWQDLSFTAYPGRAGFPEEENQDYLIPCQHSFRHPANGSLLVGS